MEPVKGELKMESLMIPIDSVDSIHLKHICIDKDGPPVFMLHGAVENGKICYSDSGRAGLGPYLARHGYDVYVGDLRAGAGVHLMLMPIPNTAKPRQLPKTFLPLLKNNIAPRQYSAALCMPFMGWSLNPLDLITLSQIQEYS